VKKIRELRERQFYNATDFAKKIGISRAYLSMLENGRLKPSIRMMRRIAQGLGMKPEDIFSEKGDQCDL